MCQHCTQVAHRPRGHKQSSLLAHDLGSVLLQPVYSGVLSVHIVSNLSLRFDKDI